MVKNTELYDDWLSDNKRKLIEEFIEAKEEEFIKYCLQEFNIWYNSR